MNGPSNRDPVGPGWTWAAVIVLAVVAVAVVLWAVTP